jgi:tetratricopeptide (TPR) repeat protein
MQDALGLYRQAVGIKPGWTEGWWYLGALLYDQDQYGAARDALRRLVVLDKKAGPAFAMLGLCEYRTKEYERALADINEGRRLGLGADRQAKRVVLYHAVLLFTRFGLYEAALQVLEQVVKEGEITPSVIQACGLAGLRKPIAPEELGAADKDLVDEAGRAVCAMAAHKPTEAQQHFADLLAHYPNTPNVHYLYGSFLLASNADAGLREFQKELEMNPKHSEALITTALEYEKRGDAETAIPYAQRAVAADPRFFAAHGVLGRMLANSGEVQ